MRNLIIPDIHHKVEKADRILEAEKFDAVYFLGDWADDFGDNSDIAAKTATWVKRQLSLPNRYFIFGNHDIAYAPFPCEELSKCAGFSMGKALAINQILSPRDWAKISFYYIVNDWLLTHAGLHEYHYRMRRKSRANSFESVEQFLRRENRLARNELNKPHGKHWFFEAGRARYGTARVGGLTWCDATREFQPIENVKQIFGHTPGSEVLFINKNNVCIDTMLNFYGVLENGNLEIREINELP